MRSKKNIKLQTKAQKFNANIKQKLNKSQQQILAAPNSSEYQLEDYNKITLVQTNSQIKIKDPLTIKLKKNSPRFKVSQEEFEKVVDGLTELLNTANSFSQIQQNQPSSKDQNILNELNKKLFKEPLKHPKFKIQEEKKQSFQNQIQNPNKNNPPSNLNQTNNLTLPPNYYQQPKLPFNQLQQQINNISQNITPQANLMQTLLTNFQLNNPMLLQFAQQPQWNQELLNLLGNQQILTQLKKKQTENKVINIPLKNAENCLEKSQKTQCRHANIAYKIYRNQWKKKGIDCESNEKYHPIYKSKQIKKDRQQKNSQQ